MLLKSYRENLITSTSHLIDKEEKQEEYVDLGARPMERFMKASLESRKEPSAK